MPLGAFLPPGWDPPTTSDSGDENNRWENPTHRWLGERVLRLTKVCLELLCIHPGEHGTGPPRKARCHPGTLSPGRAFRSAHPSPSVPRCRKSATPPASGYPAASPAADRSRSNDERITSFDQAMTADGFHHRFHKGLCPIHRGFQLQIDAGEILYAVQQFLQSQDGLPGKLLPFPGAHIQALSTLPGSCGKWLPYHCWFRRPGSCGGPQWFRQRPAANRSQCHPHPFYRPFQRQLLCFLVPGQKHP